MFDNLYGLEERKIDHNRVVIPCDRECSGHEVVILKDTNENYYVHLYDNLKNKVNELKREAYHLPREEFIQRVNDLDKMFLMVVNKAKMDRDRRISLPEEILRISKEGSIYFLGEQDHYRLFTSYTQYEDFKNEKLIQKK